VLDLEEHTRREPREFLVVGDLERHRTIPGEQVALHGDRPAVEAQRERHQSPPFERTARVCTKHRKRGRIVPERGSLSALPAVSLELEEFVEPEVEITIERELIVFDLAELAEAARRRPRDTVALANLPSSERRICRSTGRSGTYLPDPALSPDRAVIRAVGKLRA
jgi:hypothetical protein